MCLLFCGVIPRYLGILYDIPNEFCFVSIFKLSCGFPAFFCLSGYQLVVNYSETQDFSQFDFDKLESLKYNPTMSW